MSSTSGLGTSSNDGQFMSPIGASYSLDESEFYDVPEDEVKQIDDSREEDGRSVSSTQTRGAVGTVLGEDHFLLELWRIFTFYGLHTDATQPEVMRVASFVRFTRDTQMLSSRLTSTMVELEIVRLAREKRIEEYGGKEISGEGNTIALNFGDFLALLDLMAPKVYPMPTEGSSVEEIKKIQVRRLLLENVLLLANRREKLTFVGANAVTRVLEQFPRAKPPPTPEDVIALYRASLGSIFKYYVEKANKRRSNELSADAAKKGIVGSQRRMRGNEASRKHASHTRELLHAMRTDLIGYPEFMQFCTDFSLRSTSLLTAVQVGELYLHSVPLDPDQKCLRQMNESMFHTLLVNMAMLAYRNCHPMVLPHNKIKALLNYMWRGVNCSEKVDRLAVAGRAKGSASSSSHAGSLNMFGAGPFSAFYLDQWIGEPTGQDIRERDPDLYREQLLTGHLYPQSMPDYTAPPEEPHVDGKTRLAKIVREQQEGALRLREARAAAMPPSPDAADLLAAPPPPPPLPSAAPSNEPAVLHDFQLAALFRLRPEIGELVYLEIRNLYAEMASKAR